MMESLPKEVRQVRQGRVEALSLLGEAVQETIESGLIDDLLEEFTGDTVEAMRFVELIQRHEKEQLEPQVTLLKLSACLSHGLNKADMGSMGEEELHRQLWEQFKAQGDLAVKAGCFGELIDDMEHDPSGEKIDRLPLERRLKEHLPMGLARWLSDKGWCSAVALAAHNVWSSSARPREAAEAGVQADGRVNLAMLEEAIIEWSKQMMAMANSPADERDDRGLDVPNGLAAALVKRGYCTRGALAAHRVWVNSGLARSDDERVEEAAKALAREVGGTIEQKVDEIRGWYNDVFKIEGLPEGASDEEEDHDWCIRVEVMDEQGTNHVAWLGFNKDDPPFASPYGTDRHKAFRFKTQSQAARAGSQVADEFTSPEKRLVIYPSVGSRVSGVLSSIGPVPWLPDLDNLIIALLRPELKNQTVKQSGWLLGQVRNHTPEFRPVTEEDIDESLKRLCRLSKIDYHCGYWRVKKIREPKETTDIRDLPLLKHLTDYGWNEDIARAAMENYAQTGNARKAAVAGLCDGEDDEHFEELAACIGNWAIRRKAVGLLPKMSKTRDDLGCLLPARELCDHNLLNAVNNIWGQEGFADLASREAQIRGLL